MCEVLTIGEPMVMFLADTKEPLSQVNHFTKMIAGAELNVAMGLARLGHSVAYMTQVGNDPFGEYIKDFLKKEQIDDSYVTMTSEAPTGFQIKNQVDEGDPEVIYFRKGSAASKATKDLLKDADFHGSKILHVTGIFPALNEQTREMTKEFIRMAHEKGLLVTFDPNPRPVLWDSEEQMIQETNKLACMCDVVMPGFREGKLFTGLQTKEEIADYYLNQGVKKVIIKLGTSGSYSKERLQEGTYQESEEVCFKVPVVDTVGAGDGFAAGVISAALEGLDNQKILERGNAIGAMQVMNLSDNEGLPTISKLNEFLKTYQKKK